MLFRKTLAFSAFVMSTAAIFSAPAPALADKSWRQKEGDAGYAPIQSISYEFGSKAMSGYFVPQGSVCLVTLMISERAIPTGRRQRRRLASVLCLNPVRSRASTARRAAHST